jgi:dihydrodipicolinate reductase
MTAAIIEPIGTTKVPRNNGTFNAMDILIDSSSPDVLKNTLNELKIKVPHKPIVGPQ